jgi:hypothetical protein
MKFLSFSRLFGEGWLETKTRRRRKEDKRLQLERLEDRTLLAVIPAGQVGPWTDASAPPDPVEEVFVKGLDDQVWAMKMDSGGTPVGGYFLTTPGAVKSFVSTYDAFGIPIVYAIGLNDQVYYEKFDSNSNNTTPYNLVTAGAVKQITLGHDAAGDPELFVIGLDNQVWAEKLTSQGDPDGTFNHGNYFFTSGGAVKSIKAAHDASNRPEIFALGQNDNMYYMKFDSLGVSASAFFNVDPGAVLGYDVGQDASGKPVLFVIGLNNVVYGHKFDVNGDSDHLNYYLAVFDSQGHALQASAITVGHDANRNPEVWATAMSNQNVYDQKFSAAGDPDPAGFFLAATGAIKQIAIAYDASNDPELFAIGLNDNVYYATFDSTGRPTAPYVPLQRTPAAVKYVTTTPSST